MKARFNSMLPRDRRGTFRILHEDHRTHGGDRLSTNALKGSLRRESISSPIVSVHDQKTSVRRQASVLGCLLGSEERAGRLCLRRNRQPAIQPVGWFCFPVHKSLTVRNILSSKNVLAHS